MPCFMVKGIGKSQLITIIADSRSIAGRKRVRHGSKASKSDDAASCSRNARNPDAGRNEVNMTVQSMPPCRRAN